jgi:carbon-monoxide dehydrogenase small subunit
VRRVALTVNGTAYELELEPRELLVYVLRDRLGLTRTNVGCDTSSCGSCTVLVDGLSAKSCTLLGVQVDGAEITRSRASRRTASCIPSSRRSTTITRSCAGTARRGW